MNNSKNNKNIPFSYPYNFVSLGDTKNINRKEREKGKYSGKIKCTLKNLTPIFIGNKTDEKEEKTLTLNVEGKEKYVIPASTLKGEIRNIIEVLTTSCIKNVEEERLDYRGKVGGRKNVFGIIDKFPFANGDGRILGTDKVKVKVYTKDNRNKKTYLLPEFKSEGFYSIKINEQYTKHISKNEKPDDPKVDDPKAINNAIQFENITKGGTIDAILWVSSDMFNKKYEKILVPNGKIYSFRMSDYEDLLYLIKQRKEAEEKKEENFYIDELKIKDTIIFETDNNDIAKNLTFSEIPRLRYKISPLDLVPEEFHPCTTEKLCFACRMFGTTGDTSKNKINEKKEEKIIAMASKVFISDALSINERNKNMEEKLNLNPLGEPHPSLASFYLESGTYDNQNSQIRGRKFYWHHSEKIKIGKGYANYLETLKYKGPNPKVASTIHFLKPDQSFEFEVSFKDLTDEELGILIYSLELEKDLLHKFGKAKAFGFGSCKIEITDCLLESPEKYSSFVKSYEKLDKEKYLKIAKDKYKLNTDERKEIKELKTILKSTNNLDFKESPFPIDCKRDKYGNLKGDEKNSLNWFINKKRETNFKLPYILDYTKK